jgi:hypothetical protein
MTSHADRITAGNTRTPARHGREPGSVTTATGIVIRPDPTATNAVQDMGSRRTRHQAADCRDLAAMTGMQGDTAALLDRTV